jgi:hypothetical protein
MSVLNAIIKFSEAPKVAIGARFHLISIRNDFKTPSNVRMLRCNPTQNTHILSCMLRFQVGLRLAFDHNLQF